ncbi:MAG: Holliday junction resolvase RuvX [Actinobacteria bacterium]|nr:Holliday junction resolvase RuvX [Actinomycetota bacterium]
MRALGIDLGSKRIGIAISDRSGIIASPLRVLARSGSPRRDHAAIAALAVEEEVELLVVGLPLNMNGTLGPAAQAALREADALATVVAVPVVTFDERRTTVTADRALIEGGISARGRRALVDKVAAAVMLQHWLDSRAAQAR